MAALELVRKLIEAGRGAETGRFIASALASAHGAAALNHRLVQFSRRQPLEPKPLAINELITGMEELLRRSLPNSIRLDLDLAADLWEARCDAGEAETALLNLALNARDAMPDGGVLKIQTGNVDANKNKVYPAVMAPGQYVYVTVTDSGTGMTPEVTRHAFDAFFTTKTTKMAIGLGLTMVRRFARENGGDAEIESESGRGTLVTFYLPRYRPEPKDRDLD
jgi:signal transduction histidine kinase